MLSLLVLGQVCQQLGNATLTLGGPTVAIWGPNMGPIGAYWDHLRAFEVAEVEGGKILPTRLQGPPVHCSTVPK